MSTSTTETPKPNRSTKLLLVVFIVLSVLLFVYGYLQKLEADKQAAIAITNLEVARKLEKEAMMMFEMARKQQAMAEQQRLLAEQVLEDCKKSKR